MKRRVLQLIPAPPGWRIQFHVLDGDKSIPITNHIVAWALVDVDDGDRHYQVVAAVDHCGNRCELSDDGHIVFPPGEGPG